MQVLYHSKGRLEYWVDWVRKDLYDPDRNDVWRFVESTRKRQEYTLDNQVYNTLLAIKRQLDKLFNNTNKEDTKLTFKWMQ